MVGLRSFGAGRTTEGMDRLARSLREAPVVEMEGYQYFVHPITDGIPHLEPALLREIVVGIIRCADLAGVEKIVTPAAMGIHIGTAVSLATDIPLVVVRKRSYGLPGEVAVHQVTGYAEGELFLNGVEAGDRVLVVDDVVSTGGTLRAILEALEEVGAEVADVVTVITKEDGGERLADAAIRVKTLATVVVEDGRVVVREIYPDE